MRVNCTTKVAGSIPAKGYICIILDVHLSILHIDSATEVVDSIRTEAYICIMVDVEHY